MDVQVPIIKKGLVWLKGEGPEFKPQYRKKKKKRNIGEVAWKINSAVT
jgi:hypothetical protein